MTKFTLNIINAIAETISVIGLAIGNTNIRIACGIAFIVYKWFKVYLSSKKLKKE